MTTREKNELKKLQRKKEVRRQYEKIAIILGVIIVIVFAGKMILGKKNQYQQREMWKQARSRP